MRYIHQRLDSRIGTRFSDWLACLYEHIAIAIYFNEKHLNFIYSGDKTFWVIRIMDFNRIELTCYSTNFPYASSG